MWRPTAERKYDERWGMRGSSNDPWVMGLLEPILLLVALAIIAALVGWMSG